MALSGGGAQSGAARVIPGTSSEWQVVDDAGRVIAAGLSNERAWRLAEKINGEVLSPAEKRHAYGWELKGSMGRDRSPQNRPRNPRRKWCVSKR